MSMTAPNEIAANSESENTYLLALGNINKQIRIEDIFKIYNFCGSMTYFIDNFKSCASLVDFDNDVARNILKRIDQAELQYFRSIVRSAEKGEHPNHPLY